MLSMFRKDLERYRFELNSVLKEPSVAVVFLFRLRQAVYPALPKPLRLLLKLALEPAYIFATLLFGIHLPQGATIGPGLLIHHFGGIMINPLARIGSNCTLRHNVTIGNRKTATDVPILGDDVTIGTGAVILGDIRIGNHVTIGANAVVLNDVPDNHIAVGNPARILPKKG